MLFVSLIFVSSDNLVRSHCWLAITSTILLVAAIISGLGLTAAVGFKFSALTTQVNKFKLSLNFNQSFAFTGCSISHDWIGFGRDRHSHEEVHESRGLCSVKGKTIIEWCFE